MVTPEEYIQNKIPIIPCYHNTRKPIGDQWQDQPTGDIKRFSPGDNIGWHLIEQSDIDIDNPICHKFLNEIKTRCCAVYGRKSNPQSHLLFTGKNEYKKWTMHKDFEPWFKKFRKQSTILELRSGKGFQSIAPGSIIDGEEVCWDRYEELKPYPGDLRKDVELVVFATMLSILYPPKGARGDYCYAVACLLKKWGKWSAEKIDYFVLSLAEKSNDENFRNKKGKGTHAHKQLNRPDGKTKGLPALMEILKVSGEAIKDIFEVVGIEIGKEQKEEFKKERLDPTAWKQGIKASDLAKKELKDIEWVVDQIISPGLTIIAGKSKIGKSWLVLWLSYAIEFGLEFLGRQCAKGNVLHYSLEDGKRRIKNRWKVMDINPTETYYQFRDRKPKIPLLTMGLEEEIENWCNDPAIKNPKMVVVDVYVKVKKTISRNLNAYENDNYNLQNLQTLSTKYNIAIVLVHHTKKGSENDIFDEINGSAGIQSNMDSMIVIASNRKAGKNSVFHCIPKDAEQLEFEIGMNEKMIWEDKGPVGSTTLSLLQSKIIEVINNLYKGNPAIGNGESVKSKDIHKAIQSDDELTEKSGRKGKPFSKEEINKTLERLADKDLIRKCKRGVWEPIPY